MPALSDFWEWLRPRKPQPFRKDRSFRPWLEQLEDRLTPSTTVYENDFEVSPGSEWSATTVSTTPVGGRKFLGEFSNGTVALTLADLPTHVPLPEMLASLAA